MLRLENSDLYSILGLETKLMHLMRWCGRVTRRSRQVTISDKASRQESSQRAVKLRLDRVLLTRPKAALQHGSVIYARCEERFYLAIVSKNYGMVRQTKDTSEDACDVQFLDNTFAARMAYTAILLSEPPPHELGDYLDSDDDDDLDENPDWGGGLSQSDKAVDPQRSGRLQLMYKAGRRQGDRNSNQDVHTQPFSHPKTEPYPAEHAVAIMRRPEYKLKADYHKYGGAELKKIITAGSIEGEPAALKFHEHFPLQLIDDHPDLTALMWGERASPSYPLGS